MILHGLLYSGENLVAVTYNKILCRVPIISLLMIYYFVHQQSTTYLNSNDFDARNVKL
jgi:hypothetical protein